MIKQALVAAGMLYFAAVPAYSAMLFTLGNSPFNAAAGDTVTFQGTITPDAGQDTFLTGISYAYSGGAGAYLTGDVLTFFGNVPGLFLTTDPAYSGAVFSVAIDQLTPPGTYNGTVTLRGGADEFADNPIVSSAFRVVVAPEPETLGIAGIALVALVRLRTRRV